MAKAKAATPSGKGWPGSSGLAFCTLHAAANGALYAPARLTTEALSGTLVSSANEGCTFMVTLPGSVSGVRALAVERLTDNT